MLANNIRRERESQGLSQKDLAIITGLQITAISHFECGRRTPSVKNLIRIAKALHVSLDQLCSAYNLEKKGNTMNIEKLRRESYWKARNAPIEKLKKEHSVEIATLTAERDELQRRLEMAEAERDVLNGTACAAEQADGCGPCGVCKDCLRSERDELQRRLDAVLKPFETEDRFAWNCLSCGYIGAATGADFCVLCGEEFGESGEDENGYNCTCVHCGAPEYESACPNCGATEGFNVFDGDAMDWVTKIIAWLTKRADEAERRLDAVVEAIEADARVETTALVQAVRAIAEGRE